MKGRFVFVSEKISVTYMFEVKGFALISRHWALCTVFLRTPNFSLVKFGFVKVLIPEGSWDIQYAGLVPCFWD